MLPQRFRLVLALAVDGQPQALRLGYFGLCATAALRAFEDIDRVAPLQHLDVAAEKPPVAALEMRAVGMGTERNPSQIPQPL